MVLRCKGILRSAEEGESIRIGDHEPSQNAVILKIELHCAGCIKKLKKLILKFKGVDSVSVDANKDLVMVKGTMDVPELVTCIEAKLKRKVAETEVVPLKINNKKDKDAIISDGEEKDNQCSARARSHGDKEDHKEATGSNNDGAGDGTKKEEVDDDGGSSGRDRDSAYMDLYAGDRYYIYPVESTPQDYVGRGGGGLWQLI